jgi:2-C-methyl-D-erythritol 4-phosphate cytidylyltransferase / 2-C-methyl-D-erythritol 2,4-cyclodiphosphate synthase
MSSPSPRRVHALIVCAGRGQRMGGAIPKQYRVLGGAAILRRTALAFLDHPEVSGVMVVIHPDDRPLYDTAVEGLPLLAPAYGGTSRDASVRLGLEALEAEAPDCVLIHDGVRPFVTAATIAAVTEALTSSPAAIAAMPVFDTIKRCEGGVITATIERAPLWRAQTPQGFHYATILAAHRMAASRPGHLPALTDDAAVAEEAGIPVRVVEGSEDNFKITTEADLRRAERHLRELL